MPIVFHFGQQNGQPTTTMDSPAQGVFGSQYNRLNVFPTEN